MDENTLKQELRELIVEIAEIETISDEASFKDEGIDSMMGVEIVTAIERKYQVKFEESELQQITTLQKSLDLLKTKLDGKTKVA
jgi:acyl carrier protein